jgi:hypothetical protein
VLVVIALGACSSPEQGPLASGWHVRTVDTAHDTGVMSDLAIDASGVRHVAYYENRDTAVIRYARQTDTGWIRQDVAHDANSIDVSIAVDGHGRVHVAFMDASSYDLRYGVRDGATWRFETVDAGGMVGWFAELALDAAGRPHIAYFRQGEWPDMAPADLRYAFHDGQRWTIETVYANFGGGCTNAITIDALGQPHIVFGGPGMVHAVRVAGVWSLRLIDPGAIHYASVAIDGAGRPHVTYYHWWEEDVRYAVLDGGEWRRESVVPNGQVVRSTSLALDADDRPHIAFNDPDAAVARYGYRDDDGWHVETVGTMSPRDHNHNSVALALDGEGAPCLTFHHEWAPGSTALRYAFRVP